WRDPQNLFSTASVIRVAPMGSKASPNVRYACVFNRSTQHLLILRDEEVCAWKGMHGHGSRRSRRLNFGNAGSAVNVWRTSPDRLRGGTRAVSIGSWLSMEELLRRHAG